MKSTIKAICICMLLIIITIEIYAPSVTTYFLLQLFPVFVNYYLVRNRLLQADGLPTPIQKLKVIITNLFTLVAVIGISLTVTELALEQGVSFKECLFWMLLPLPFIVTMMVSMFRNGWKNQYIKLKSGVTFGVRNGIMYPHFNGSKESLFHAKTSISNLIKYSYRNGTISSLSICSPLLNDNKFRFIVLKELERINNSIPDNSHKLKIFEWNSEKPQLLKWLYRCQYCWMKNVVNSSLVKGSWPTIEVKFRD